MIRFIFPVVVGVLIVLGSNECVGEPVAVERTALERTIVRFFQSMGGYEDGDLISRSQVQDLQVFLRKTNRRGLVTHPRMLIPVLTDNSRLVRLFYAKNGAKVLRGAAKSLGSYRELEELTRSSSEYHLLVESVNSNRVEDVVKIALERREQKEASKSKVPQKPRAYTVEEFLGKLSAWAKERQKSEAGA